MHTYAYMILMFFWCLVSGTQFCLKRFHIIQALVTDNFNHLLPAHCWHDWEVSTKRWMQLTYFGWYKTWYKRNISVAGCLHKMEGHIFAQEKTLYISVIYEWTRLSFGIIISHEVYICALISIYIIRILVLRPKYCRRAKCTIHCFCI